MSIDQEKLANEAMKNIDVTSILSDKKKLVSILGSAEGQQLITLLSRDGGKTLRQAAEALSKGDEQGAKDIMAPMINDEGAKLLDSLNNKAKG